MDHKKKKMYMGGGKMKPMYLKGGQVKLDANKDGEITSADFKILKAQKKKKKKTSLGGAAVKGAAAGAGVAATKKLKDAGKKRMSKGGKMMPIYKNGGKVGDPKKKEAMKLIALNEGDYDNNLGDFFRAGEMAKADSVLKVMNDRYKRIVELGYKEEALDSLPYDKLKTLEDYKKLVEEQRAEEKGMKPMFKKGGVVEPDKKSLKKSVRETARAQMKKARKTKRLFNRAFPESKDLQKDKFKQKKKLIKGVKKAFLKGVRKADITDFKK